MDSVQNWQHGDIAIAVNYEGEEKVVRYRRRQWVFADGSTMPESDTQARPLLVVDPEDRKEVERILGRYAELWGDPHYDPLGRHRKATDAMQAALRELASPTPPKPDEPAGLGAVVEDAKGDLYLLAHPGEDAAWMQVGIGSLCRWRDIDAVKVLDDGYKAGEPS